MCDVELLRAGSAMTIRDDEAVQPYLISNEMWRRARARVSQSYDLQMQISDDIGRKITYW